MRDLSAYVAFNKATKGQTDIKHEKEKKKKTYLNVPDEDHS